MSCGRNSQRKNETTHFAGQPRTKRENTYDPIRRNRRIVALLACVCCLLVGLCIGYVLVPQPVPRSLQAAGAMKSVIVGHETFDDSRNVKASPNVTYGRTLIWRGAGIITGINVSNGDTLSSGTAPFQVDGIPIIALYTSVPLYRDLTDNAIGSDVGALRDELGRLGYTVTPSSGDRNRYDWSLRQAVRELQRANGLPAEALDGNIGMNRVLWVPQSSLTLSDSALVWGQDAPRQIGSSSTALASLSIDVPSDVSPGTHVLTMNGAQTTLPADGVITDGDFLASVQESDQFRQWLSAPENQRKNLDATIRLQKPVSALKVPAGSVFGIQDDRSACVQSNGKKVPVTLFGSLNGYAMVKETNGDDLSAVDIPSAVPDRSCPSASQNGRSAPSTSKSDKDAASGSMDGTGR